MRKAVLYGIIIAVCVYAVAALFLSYRLEQQKNPLLSQQIESKQYGNVYQFYVQSQPLIEDRIVVGNPSGTTVIFVIDFLSEESKLSYNTFALSLKSEFVDQNTLAIGHKFYITKDDYDGRKGRFIYAQIARCYQTSGGNDSVSFVQKLFDTAEVDVPKLLADTGFDPARCAEDQTLYEDMIETELYRITAPSMYIGINGEDNTVLYGTPSETRVRRAVRDKQIQLGI